MNVRIIRVILKQTASTQMVRIPAPVTQALLETVTTAKVITFYSL